MDKINFFISNSEIKDARRLFLSILLLIPILLLVLTINFYIDPLGLYRKTVNKYERPEYQIAQALVAGKNVGLLKANIDDRLIQKYFIENIKVAPDIVILGSSHSMWLGENIFSDKKVINHSVLSAVLADYLGILDGYARRDLYPKRVICVLDPQLTVFPLTSERWVSIKEDTYGMLDRLGMRSDKIKQPLIPQAWLNVFSFSYFQTSIKELGNGYSQHVDGQLLFKDGRRVWDRKVLSLDTEKSRRLIIKEVDHGTFVKELSRNKPDKELKGILEKFIRYLMGKHIQVTLCLLPLHPQLYKSFLELQKRPGAFDIVGVEQYYRGLAQRLDLEIVGSYDPDACNLKGQDFYDEDHVRNDVLEKMFKQKGSQCSMPGL